MTEVKLKLPKKDAGKRLRELYEKNREKSKASDSLINGLKEPANEQSIDQQKKSALKRDMEL